jgi:hypothetical protein
MNDPKSLLNKLASGAVNQLTPGLTEGIPDDLTLTNTQTSQQAKADLARKAKPGEQLQREAKSQSFTS